MRVLKTWDSCFCGYLQENERYPSFIVEGIEEEYLSKPRGGRLISVCFDVVEFGMTRSHYSWTLLSTLSKGTKWTSIVKWHGDTIPVIQLVINELST